MAQPVAGRRGRQGSTKDPKLSSSPSAAALKLALRCAMVAGITVLPPLPLCIHGVLLKLNFRSEGNGVLLKLNFPETEKGLNHTDLLHRLLHLLLDRPTNMNDAVGVTDDDGCWLGSPIICAVVASGGLRTCRSSSTRYLVLELGRLGSG